MAPVPKKQPRRILMSNTHESTANYNLIKIKQCTTDPCEYFIVYTVWGVDWGYFQKIDHDILHCIFWLSAGLLLFGALITSITITGNLNSAIELCHCVSAQILTGFDTGGDTTNNCARAIYVLHIVRSNYYQFAIRRSITARSTSTEEKLFSSMKYRYMFYSWSILLCDRKEGYESNIKRINNEHIVK